MSNLVNGKVEINKLVNEIHDNNVKSGWWTNLETGESLKSEQGETPKRNIPEMLCLIHSEDRGEPLAFYCLVLERW